MGRGLVWNVDLWKAGMRPCFPTMCASCNLNWRGALEGEDDAAAAGPLLCGGLKGWRTLLLSRVEKHWTACCEVLSCVVAVLSQVLVHKQQLGLSCTTMLPAFPLMAVGANLLPLIPTELSPRAAQFASGSKHPSAHCCSSFCKTHISNLTLFFNISHIAWLRTHKHKHISSLQE